MKIITAAQKVEDWTTRETCHKCRADLFVAGNDLFLYRGPASLFFLEEWFVCPCCQQQQKVRHKKCYNEITPKNIREQLPTRKAFFAKMKLLSTEPAK